MESISARTLMDNMGNCERLLALHDSPEAIPAVSSRKKLVLHMDVNGTIFGEDTILGRGPENMICEALSRMIIDRWPSEDGFTEPMTYRDYVYTRLVPGRRHDPERKGSRVEKIGDLIRFLEETPSCASYTSGVKRVYDLAITTMRTISGQLFPSFVDAITLLQRSEVDFSLNVHTFGKDIDICKEITRRTGIAFHGVESMKAGLYESLEGMDQPSQMRLMYERFQAGNIPVQHDYTYWNTHNEMGPYGKLIPIVSGSGDTAIMFFDDNLKRGIDDPTSIAAPYDITTEKIMDLDPVLADGSFVSVNQIDALLDPGYFSRRIVTYLG